MRAATIALLLMVSVAGCATSSGPRGTGEVAPAPFGWDDHCAVIPKPDECKK